MPNPVNRGGSVSLQWEVEGAEAVQITPDIGLVPVKGALEVRLATTTTFILSASAGSSVWTTSIEIVVAGSTKSPTPKPTTFPSKPNPTPTPEPTPELTPTPLPEPTPYSPPDPSDIVCQPDTPRFRDVVTQAQEYLKKAHPDWFDYESMPGWVITTEPWPYFDAMIETINQMEGGKYQARPHFYEPDSHVAIKTSNEFSEAYHIITSFHGLTKGYAFTCRPAEF
jgi:hypothetical protein